MAKRELTTKRKIIFYSMAFFFFCFVTETVSYLSLKLTKRQAYHFLVWRAGLEPLYETNWQDPNCMTFNAIDPHLGYGHPEGCKVYGEQNKDALLRIATLGGSTTDPFIQKENWPKALQSGLEARGIKAIVWNCGVGGYSSSQEVIKMVRDVRPLGVDLVISLDGENDLGSYSTIPNHPMIHPHQEQFLKDLANPKPIQKPTRFLPNTVNFIKDLAFSAMQGLRPPKVEVSLGVEDSEKGYPLWLRNIRTLHAISAEFGTEYVDVLQPLMGYGQYNPTPKEIRDFNEGKERWATYNKAKPTSPASTYVEAIKLTYEPARKFCQKSHYCLDLVDVFKDRKGETYDDPRHPNPEGYKLLAESMIDQLQKRGTLKKIMAKKVNASRQKEFNSQVPI